MKVFDRIWFGWNIAILSIIFLIAIFFIATGGLKTGLMVGLILLLFFGGVEAVFEISSLLIGKWMQSKQTSTQNDD